MTLSRRSLIGGGAVLAGASAAAAVSATASAAALSNLSAGELEALDIPVMLSVTNAKKGELEILVGEQAIAFTDRSLVSTLSRAARKGVV
jgi:3-hydroxyisobutyrate dehydrogenase-like beta-hydroxyacid dehydrogenase